MFECAAKSNITDYKTVQSLLLELPRLLSLFAPTCDFFVCPPPSQSSSSLLLAPLCCTTDCRGPTLLLLPDSRPPGPSAPTITYDKHKSAGLPGTAEVTFSTLITDMFQRCFSCNNRAACIKGVAARLRRFSRSYSNDTPGNLP